VTGVPHWDENEAIETANNATHVRVGSLHRPALIVGRRLQQQTM
jgi:hypothetical protein